MNVYFRLGEIIGDTGFRIADWHGLNRFVAENDSVRIHFESDAGEGKNYSKILSYYNKETERSYTAQRYLYKYVYLVQQFSNVLFDKYQKENGTIVLDTPEEIAFAQLVVLRGRLRLELKGLTSRVNTFQVLKNLGLVDANLKGTKKNKQLAVDKLTELIEKAKQERAQS